jgi:hypothetical protein
VKFGTEDKKKTRIAVALFALAVLAVFYELWPSSVPTAAVSTAPTENAAKGTPIFSKLDPSLRLDLLKGSEDLTYTGSGRDIFHSQPEPQKEETVGKADDPRVTNPGPAPAPVHVNPPIPLRFYGFATDNDKKKIFLALGEDVFIAREGDIVKNRYKVLHVNPNNVEIQDVLGNYSQQIPLTLPNS